MSIVQYVTPFLFKGIQNIDSDRVTILDDNEDGITSFKKLLFENNFAGKVILIIYNLNTKQIIDLYLKIRPNFKLEIRSPFVLYTNEGIRTIFDYKSSNNMVYYYEETPSPEDIYSQVDIVIDSVMDLFDKNIVVIGSKTLPPDEGIYYIEDMKDAPKDVGLVIDTMMKKDDEYINFSESVERFFYFKDTVYYRLMSKFGIKKLPLSKDIDKDKLILESIKYEYDPYELFDRSNVDALNYNLKRIGIEEEGKELLKLPLGILPASFLILWKRNDYPEYPGVLMANILNDKSFLTELLSLPPITEDYSFNYVNNKRVNTNLKEIFGKGGLPTYLNIFDMISNNLDDLSNWCKKNYLNYFTVFKIDKQLHKFDQKFQSFKVLDIYTKIFDLLKLIYGDIILTEKDGFYYDKNFVQYKLDSSYTLQDYSIKLPEKIVPLLTERTASGVNVIYLYI